VTGGTEEGRKAAKDYIESMRQFPLGKHDDFEDAAADAYAEITNKSAFSMNPDDWRKVMQ
jgi:phage terminase large subunit-like protein